MRLALRMLELSSGPFPPDDASAHLSATTSDTNNFTYDRGAPLKDVVGRTKLTICYNFAGL